MRGLDYDFLYSYDHLIKTMLGSQESCWRIFSYGAVDGSASRWRRCVSGGENIFWARRERGLVWSSWGRRAGSLKILERWLKHAFCIGTSGAFCSPGPVQEFAEFRTAAMIFHVTN